MTALVVFDIEAVPDLETARRLLACQFASNRDPFFASNRDPC